MAIAASGDGYSQRGLARPHIEDLDASSMVIRALG